MNQYKEIPILFSTDMVQAILAGRKTQTRRVVKPQPIDNTEIDGNFFEGNHKGYVKVDGHPDWQRQFAAEFAKWKVGDVLWVRETFRRISKTMYQYKASYPNKEGQAERQGWKPCIHMPKEAARIWLRVKSVRVERLQDIPTIDTLREGIERKGDKWFRSYTPFHQNEYQHLYDSIETREWTLSPHVSFFSLWASINGYNGHKGVHAFIDNPWVWVIEFEVLSTTGKPNNI